MIAPSSGELEGKSSWPCRKVKGAIRTGVACDAAPLVQSRRYLPAFLEAFEFKAAPAAWNIIEAVEVLKTLSAAKSRSLSRIMRPRNSSAYKVEEKGNGLKSRFET